MSSPKPQVDETKPVPVARPPPPPVPPSLTRSAPCCRLPCSHPRLHLRISFPSTHTCGTKLSLVCCFGRGLMLPSVAGVALLLSLELLVSEWHEWRQPNLRPLGPSEDPTGQAHAHIPPEHPRVARYWHGHDRAPPPPPPPLICFTHIVGIHLRATGTSSGLGPHAHSLPTPSNPQEYPGRYRPRPIRGQPGRCPCLCPCPCLRLCLHPAWRRQGLPCRQGQGSRRILYRPLHRPDHLLMTSLHQGLRHSDTEH